MKRVLAGFGLLALSVSVAWAQEATPEVLVSGGDVEIGAARLTLPDGWYANDGDMDVVFVLNTAFENIQGQLPPEGTTAIQINLLSPLLLAQSGIAPETTAADLLLIASGQETVESEEVLINDTVAAKIVVTEEGTSQEIYSIPLEGGSFALASVFGFDPTAIAATSEQVASILASLRINFSGDLPEPAFDYSSLPQSRSGEGFPVIGNADAAAKLAEISSFSCPHCGDFHAESLPAILEIVAANDASFTYIPFYGAGNIGDGRLASIAAMCADAQDAFWLYHDALFSWQKYGSFAFDRARLIDGATNLELDVDAFTLCIDQTSTEIAVERAINYANGLDGFQGTPTLLLNAEQIATGPIEAIKLAVIEAAAGDEVVPEATAEATLGS